MEITNSQALTFTDVSKENPSDEIIIGFMDTPNIFGQQRLSGFLQTRYKLSDNFALQGKIAVYGTEHFTATVGISFMPWGDKTSLAQLFNPNQP